MTVKKIVLIITLVSLVALTGINLTSCAAAGYLDDGTAKDHAEVVEEAPDYERIAEDQEAMAESGAVAEHTQQRQIIRSGSISLSVEDTRKKVAEIRDLVNDLDGLIDSSSVYELREGQYGARMTLRVPEKHFETLLDQLENLGKATDIQTQLEDVTMHYVDLRSRLDNQKSQEERLKDILDMAESVEDVLEVEKELHRVRGEIESMTARLTQMEDQINYSTIHVSIREETIPSETISPIAFQNLGNRIREAFIGSINFVLNAISIMIIAFSALIPVLIIVIVLAIIIWLLIRRHHRRKTGPRGDSSETKYTDSDDQ